MALIFQGPINEDEFDRISLLLAEKCEKAGMPFQLGVSHMSPVIISLSGGT